MLENYLKIALRNLWRNKTYALINILGLAIGINACLIIYLIISYELSFDTFHSNREKIYRVVSHIQIAGETYKNPGVCAPLGGAVREELTGLEAVAPFHIINFRNIWIENRTQNDLLANPETRKEMHNQFVIADAQFFKIFEHQWLAGNPQLALQEPFQVVLSEEKARKYFGTEPLSNLIGKTITYGNFSDTVTVKVSGIIRSWQQNSDFDFKDYISFATLFKTRWAESTGMKHWDNTNSSSQLFLKLSKGSQAHTINTNLAKLSKKYEKKEKVEFKKDFHLQPLSDIHFNSDYGGNQVKLAHLPTLYGLMGIAGFLLLIASINFINLTTAQSLQRAKEVGIRKVLGSTRLHLIGQFLCEALLLTLFATFISAIFAEPMLWLFSDFVVEGIREELYSLKILGFLILLILMTTFLSGFYPSLVLASLKPVASLKNQTSKRGSRKSALRKGLIVFQFAFAQVFIIGTLVVGSQIRFMLHQDMGFDKEAIIDFDTPWHAQDKDRKKMILLEKLRQIPEVKLVSLSQSTPAEQGYSTTVLTYKAKGKKPIETNVHRKSADSNYLKLYNIKLLAGRNVMDSDTTKELIINKAYAKILGFQKPEDAVGHYLYMGITGSDKFPIVGVFADFHVHSLHQGIEPTFISAENSNVYTFNVKLHTKDKNTQNLKNAIQKIETEWKVLFPNEAFEYQFLDDKIAKFYEKEQKIAYLLSIATTVAIFISCIGLFGLVTFTVEARTKEIGIRKVLGATVRQITSLLSYDFVRLVLISILIASPIAYYFAQNWLNDFAYRMNLSALIFVGAAVISILITFITVSFKAIKAAMKNPVEALRYE